MQRKKELSIIYPVQTFNKLFLINWALKKGQIWGEWLFSIRASVFLNLKCSNIWPLWLYFIFSKLCSLLCSCHSKTNDNSIPDVGHSEIQNHCLLEQPIWKRTIYITQGKKRISFHNCLAIAWEILQRFVIIIRFYSDAGKLAYICGWLWKLYMHKGYLSKQWESILRTWTEDYKCV